MRYSETLQREYTADEEARYQDMRLEVVEVILHPDIRMEIGALTFEEVFNGLQDSFGFREGSVIEAIAKDVAADVVKEYNEAIGQGGGSADLGPTAE